MSLHEPGTLWTVPHLQLGLQWAGLNLMAHGAHALSLPHPANGAQGVLQKNVEFLMSESKGYNGLQIGLHWLVGLGVLFNYFVSDGMAQAFDAKIEGKALASASLIPTLHVWVGVTILALVLIRILVRLTKGAPSAEPGIQGMAVVWGHRALYLLMLAVPLAGALTWFLGIESLADLHVLEANILMVLK